jgi:transmembrane sensor
VKDALRKQPTEASVARMWNRIEARERTVANRPSRRTWALVGLVGVAAGVAIVLGWARSDAGHRGPVALASGAALGVTVARAQESVCLDDGSVLTFESGAFVEPLKNTEDAVVLRQARGVISYDIAPHGPRRWTIECGAISVEVVGTTFRIDRDEHHVRVDVMRGVVLVRGERVPDHVVRLVAGMHVDVSVDEPTAHEVSAVFDPSSNGEVAHTAPPRATEVANTSSHTQNAGSGAKVRQSDATWRELAARGANADAYAELGHDGVARAARSASVDELFALADVARLSGHPEEAVAPLERVLASQGEARAPIAALTLGRIQLRSLRTPALAARTLEHALELGVPSDLAEEANALLIESLSRAGEPDAARNAFTQFVARFPRSERLGELPQWLRDP